MEDKYLEMVKNSLLTVLCNATGIFRRTIDPKDKEFKIKLEKTKDKQKIGERFQQFRQYYKRFEQH